MPSVYFSNQKVIEELLVEDLAKENSINESQRDFDLCLPKIKDVATAFEHVILASEEGYFFKEVLSLLETMPEESFEDTSERLQSVPEVSSYEASLDFLMNGCSLLSLKEKKR